MDITLLLWSFLVSTVGFGYLMFGKKSYNIVAILSGIAMMIYPYFINNIIISIIIGILLFFAPYVIKL